MITVISVILAIYTIISKNPVVSILFLIGLFFTVSLYLMTIGLHFIGLSYLLVYVGAVSMLFLFILMLINIRVSELITDNNNSIPLAVITVLLFNYSVSSTIPYISYNDVLSLYPLTDIILASSNTIKASSLASDSISSLTFHNDWYNVTNMYSSSWDSMLVTSSHITSIGNILYTNLFILFIIASLILLLAMVGAIMITINRSNKSPSS